LQLIATAINCDQGLHTVDASNNAADFILRMTMNTVKIRCFLVLLCCILAKNCAAFTASSQRHLVPISIAARPSVCSRRTTSVQSSFFGDFEDFDGEDSDDDDDDYGDDDYDDVDEAALAAFRAKMDGLLDSNDEALSDVDELISFATSKASEEASTDWANPVDKVEAGVVLVANPAKFCANFGGSSSSPSSSLLSKFGLTLPPPADLGPDRRADLLPVLVILEKHPLRGSQAVLMNRRTGYLLGDLEQKAEDSIPGTMPTPKLGAFMIQPLWFGGTSAGSQETASSGLDMLHLCPAVEGAKQITKDGLYWGGDPAQAQEAMKDPSLDRPMSGFDFKFYVQTTRWLPLQLENEVRDETWFVASVSKEILFKSRDRMGTRRAKPLWTEIMELMGGKYKGIRDRLYNDE
jgi:hypothetical protein